MAGTFKVLCETQQASYCYNILWWGHLTNRLHLGWVRTETLPSGHIPYEWHLPLPELQLLWIQFYSFFTPLQGYFQILVMINSGLLLGPCLQTQQQQNRLQPPQLHAVLQLLYAFGPETPRVLNKFQMASASNDVGQKVSGRW